MFDRVNEMYIGLKELLLSAKVEEREDAKAALITAIKIKSRDLITHFRVIEAACL